MIDFDNLPIDKEEYENYDEPLEFPFLDPNTAEGCSRSLEDIEWYAKVEMGIQPENLRFVRTADVNGLKCWVWEGIAATDEKVYVAEITYGQVSLLDTSYGELWFSPEKYLALRYAENWEWFNNPDEPSGLIDPTSTDDKIDVRQ